jgi:hypothetical protein
VKGRPDAISANKLKARLKRITAISRELGFVGSVEYRHVYSQSGGAQYGIGASATDDIMVLYAEAFERDANPEDYCLEALIAHECGHQRLRRDPRFRPVLAQFPDAELKEVLASLVGAILIGDPEASETLKLKATIELIELGTTVEHAQGFVERLEKHLRSLL